jgi:hypothetical protein
LVVWFDGRNMTNMTNDGSGVISSWTDNIAGITPTAATTARPTWSADGLSTGVAAVVGDGVANAMTTTSFAACPTGTNPSVILAVFSNTSDGADTRNVGGYGVSATPRSLRQLATGVPSVQSNTSLSNTVTNSMLGAHIMVGIYELALLSGRLDGSPFTPVPSVAQTLTTTATRLRLFSSLGTSTGAFGQGGLRHFMVLTTTTDNEILQLEGWAAWDSGLQANLPVTHPYRYVRP